MAMSTTGFDENLRALNRAVETLRDIRCGCDPHEVVGLVPGRRCPSCEFLREPWEPQTALVFIADAARDLRVAETLAGKVLIAHDDGDVSRRKHALAAASEIAGRAANALAFAQASLNEEGATSVGAYRRRDQDPGRP
jgi:hypothetical protein